MRGRYHPRDVFVSLLIPCRNATAWLPAFLPRLASLHHATYPSFPEIVFIDDASNDGTPRLLFHWAESAFLPVKVLGLDAPSGQGACLREGMALAGGEAIAWCHGPMAPLESALAPLLASVHAGAHVAAVRARISWRTQVLSAALRVRYRLTPDSIAVVTSPLSLWRRESLIDALPKADGLSASVEAGLRSLALGHVHHAVDVDPLPVTTWALHDGRAAKWLWKPPIPSSERA